MFYLKNIFFRFKYLKNFRPKKKEHNFMHEIGRMHPFLNITMEYNNTNANKPGSFGTPYMNMNELSLKTLFSIPKGLFLSDKARLTANNPKEHLC